MSVFQLDGEGNDLSDPANVRYFLMSSLPHAAGTGPGICQQNRNPLVPNPVMRALLGDMDQWVSSGTEPRRWRATPAGTCARCRRERTTTATPVARRSISRQHGPIESRRATRGRPFRSAIRRTSRT
jgi:hypothetical protein